MGESVTVDVVGLPQAQADIDRWVKELPSDVSVDTRSFADSLRDQVSSEQPVLTGALAASAVIVPDPDGFAIGLGEGLEYAGWIEFGGSRGRDLVPEGRTVYPTVYKRQGEYQNVLADAIQDSINRFHWSTATA